jgi:DNA-binding transcriptional ArsR family regulator
VGRDFTELGRALSAPARSTIINLLMDGSSRPAGELAASAGVRPSTASEHLAALMTAGILTCVPYGRRRFYRIADADVAAALEQLGHLCPPSAPISYRQTRDARRMAHARFCYDHLAGHLGVALTDAMVARDWLEGRELLVTAQGRHHLPRCGIDIQQLAQRKRPLTRSCPDWTERRPHLAGALGAAIASLFLTQGWVRRNRRSRGLTVTPAGSAALNDLWHAPVNVDTPASRSGAAAADGRVDSC